MRRLLGLAFGFLLLLPFCGAQLLAQSNTTAFGRFTSSGSAAVIVYGLSGATNCSFVDGGGTPGNILVQGGYNGSFTNLQVTDSGGSTHGAAAWTPAINTQYFFSFAGYDTIQVVPDASFSGDITIRLTCVGVPVALATVGKFNVSVVNTPAVNVNNTPGVAIEAPTDGSGFVKVNCETGCAGGGGSNVTIVAPTNAAGQVIVTTPAPVATVFVANTPGFICISGCAGGGATIPPETSTTSPQPVATSLPVIGQNYWWNGSGWIAVTSTSPLPVTTPAPVATVFIVNTPAVNQGTSPWVVNTVAPFNAPAATASPNGAPTPLALLPVANCQPSATVISCQSIINGIAQVNTPAPVATVFIANTPAVNQGTSPWVVSCSAAANCPVNANQVTSPWVVTTPYNSPQPLPTATAGVAPTAAAGYPQYLAIGGCSVPVGGTPNASGGNTIVTQCDSGGNQKVNIAAQALSPIVVSTINPSLPAPQATFPVSCTFAGCLVTIPTPTSNVAVFPGATIGVTTPVPFNTSSPLANGNTNIIAIGQAAGAPESPIVCTNRAAANLATTQATATLLVASASGKSIYVCAVVMTGVTSAGAANFGLETSTGNTCVTPITLFQGIGTTTGANVFAGSGLGMVTKTSSGVALCFFNPTTTPTNATISIMYEQFFHGLTPDQLSAYCSVPKRCLLYGLFKKLNHLLDFYPVP